MVGVGKPALNGIRGSSFAIANAFPFFPICSSRGRRRTKMMGKNGLDYLLRIINLGIEQIVVRAQKRRKQTKSKKMKRSS